MPTTVPIALPDLREVAQLTPADDGQRLPVRRGTLSVCFACRQSVASHFDMDGRFVGCTAAADGTVFVLFPVQAVAPTDRATVLQRTGRRRATPPPAVTAGKRRGFQRARYFANFDHIKKVGKGRTTAEIVKSLDLGKSADRPKVLAALIEARDDGGLLADLVKKTGLERGAVGQVCSWLQKHDLAVAREDTTKA